MKKTAEEHDKLDILFTDFSIFWGFLLSTFESSERWFKI